jgi:diguanylate cyclase (GGDEF)-like protein
VPISIKTAALLRLSDKVTLIKVTHSRLLKLFSISSDDPELVSSQLGMLSRQIPLLYLLLGVNTMIVAHTYWHLAPLWLAVYLPGCMVFGCAVRLVLWSRMRARAVAHLQAVAQLRRTVSLMAVLGALHTAWALSLFPYGDAYAQAHVAFYMAITVIGCIFCLMHLQPAALLLTGIVVGPFTVFFAMTGKPVFIAIAVNMLLVAVAMVFILVTHYRDFTTLIASRKALLRQQQATQRLSDENFRLANLDSLTGLPNRRSFFSSLAHTLERADAEHRRFVVGLVDLDGFKQINDVYGHAFGDQVLNHAGARLLQLAGPGMLLGRLGGDEFGIVIDAELSNEAVLAIGAKISAALSQPYEIAGVRAQLSGSVGFAAYPEVAQTAELLFERADYAMYHAKDHLRGGPVLFSREHETAMRQAGLIEQELRRADLDEVLSLAFQPIVDIAHQRVVGFEALARWHDPVLGHVPPDVFIRVAERCDMIGRLTIVLLRKALAAARGWPDDVYVSFNLSARDIASSDHIQRIVAIVAESGLANRRIEFEVTETAVMPDFAKACAALRTLRATGARIALDDFGTGYSSLSYVHRLALDKIKIDRSFIADLGEYGASASIVRTVLDLCRNLRLDCVVEGVETRGQLEMLLQMGCAMGQGYLFARPMSAADALDLLDKTLSAHVAD